MAIYADGSATVDATAAQARSITAMPHGYIRNCDHTCLRLQSLSGKGVYAVLPPPMHCQDSHRSAQSTGQLSAASKYCYTGCS